MFEKIILSHSVFPPPFTTFIAEGKGFEHYMFSTRFGYFDSLCS